MSIDFIGGGLGQIGSMKQHNLQGSSKTLHVKDAEFLASMDNVQQVKQGDSVESSERSQKIAALKEQIQTGSYHVDSKSVADKLLSSVFATGEALLEG